MKKKKANQIDFGSYSDLFMVMSFVFLFMYVVSSINTGITVIQERHRADAQQKKLATTVEKYERKLETDLSDEQKKEYDRLKAGLVKLKEDARLAREYQEKMAQQARAKEKELDVYQETITAMMVEQLKVNEKIKEKEDFIAKVKEETGAVIAQQDRAIASLKDDIENKEQVLREKVEEIQKRENEISSIQKRVEKLRHVQVLADSQAKELKELTSSLQEKEVALQEAKDSEAAIAKEKSDLYKASVLQVNRLNKEKEKIVKNSQAEIERLEQERNQVEETLEAEKAALVEAKQNELKKLKAQKDAEKAALIASKEKELSELKASKEAELKGLKEKYQKATEGLRKEIANSLASELRNSGLNASVNPSTGDVTVHFKHAYFDYNSSVLKNTMKEELRVFIPVYAKSLLSNKKYATAISTVEIIGSSSPSFKGKYVNPRAIASADERKAMTYNLDLSYRRAKSIFDYTFLGQELAFDHKEQMIPLIKVTGTGYLRAMEELESLPKEKQDKSKGFCGLYDCEVFQKVTLRFNLKDKVTQK